MRKPPRKLSERVERPVTMMIYGTTGAGKTVFSCGSQQLRTLHLDIDKGVQSAESFRGAPATELTAPIPPTDLNLVTSLECDCFDDVLAGHELIRRQPELYDLVVVDTATELQRMVLAELSRKTGQDVISQREWGIALNMMDELTRQFKALGKHVIFTAHEMSSDDEYERRVVYRPAFQGAFRDYYARHFSVIARYVMLRQTVTGSDGTKRPTLVRALQCGWDGTCHAKDRFSALEPWEVPFIDTVFAKLLATPSTAPLNGAEEIDHAEGQAGARPGSASPVSTARRARARTG